MSAISPHHATDLRDLENAEAEARRPGSEGAAARFDYAKLLKSRAGPMRPVSRAVPAAARPGPRATAGGTDDGAQDENGSAGGPARARARFALSSGIGEVSGNALEGDDGRMGDSVLAARVTHAAEPLVSSVLQRQQQVLDLVSTLSREISGFTSDAAVVDRGNWEVQIPLDARLVPSARLYMTLSRYHLALRFDVSDPAAKQLLLDHSAMLERELDASLRAWGEPRDIQLTIW